MTPKEPRRPFHTASDAEIKGGEVYDVYFERSLGYLQFSSMSESSTRELLDALAQHFVWSRGTESNSA